MIKEFCADLGFILLNAYKSLKLKISGNSETLWEQGMSNFLADMTSFVLQGDQKT